MASYVVPPKNKPIIKCTCGALYVTEKIEGNWAEKCPICGCTSNHLSFNRIPLWQYNLIKWFRGGFKDAAN